MKDDVNLRVQSQKKYTYKSYWCGFEASAVLCFDKREENQQDSDCIDVVYIAAGGRNEYFDNDNLKEDLTAMKTTGFDIMIPSIIVYDKPDCPSQAELSDNVFTNLPKGRSL